MASHARVGRELEAHLFGGVRRVLRNAGKLEIPVREGGSDPGSCRAELVFYDRTKATEAMVEHPRFCGSTI